jgi:hypothetical protein
MEGGTLQLQNCQFHLNHIAFAIERADFLDMSTVAAQGDSLRILSAQGSTVKSWKITDTSFTPYFSGEINTVSTSGVSLGGCAVYPCTPGFSCSYHEYSLACTPCPRTEVSLKGLECQVCPAGTEPNQKQNGCSACPAGRFSDGLVSPICRMCDARKVATSDGRGCERCPVGEEPSQDRGRCDCAEGYASYDANSACTACDSTEFPNQMCPGGPKGDAGVYPKPGYWMAAWQKNVSVAMLQDLVYSCNPREMCTGFTEQCRGSPDRCCRELHSGPLCATCTNSSAGVFGWSSEEYGKTNKGLCTECHFSYGSTAKFAARSFVQHLATVFYLQLMAGNIDVQTSGAAVTVLLFFFQILYLLGKGTKSNLYGIKDIFISTFDQDFTEPGECAFGVYIALDVKVILTPPCIFHY